MQEEVNITVNSLADEIAFRIQEDIFGGKYAPGVKLYQEDLAKRYGVSRTPIREALNRLAAQGLVIKQANRGAIVRRVMRTDLRESYVVRAELEGFAAELAVAAVDEIMLAKLDDAQQVTMYAVQRLRSGVSSTEEAASINDRLSRGNSDFHNAIHEAAGNRRLKEMIDDLQSSFPKDYVWRALTSDQQLLELNVDQHLAIRDALAAGDGAAARKLMREHILYAWTLFDGYLERLEFWDENGALIADRRSG